VVEKVRLATIHFHPDGSSSSLSDDYLLIDTSKDDCRDRDGSGGAEVIFRDDGGGNDIIRLFSEIRSLISPSFKETVSLKATSSCGEDDTISVCSESLALALLTRVSTLSITLFCSVMNGIALVNWVRESLSKVDFCSCTAVRRACCWESRSVN
jgi:hypothetical protein